MSNSFRIRTEPGVDKSLNVLIDQEFEYLEILSLKLLQSQIYTRQCSDYGVIVGRVSVNNGFGIPNAKVSVFIPLDTNDELNPVTSDLYPYKTLTDLNEDGYRYNLLPYVKSHSGHNPTGTFFNREDVLTDPTLIQVYDKYFKYSTVTNSSGDYMIFGVPTGSQTVVVDIDLSDIGEFSLSPQDLIRMGLATPAQVAGINFKSSTNLNSLPQIINFNRTIEVEPLWGQPEICNLGITRTDFDLSKESGIDIRPTSIFMGSIVSSNDDEALPRNCKPRLKSGSQCTLVTGPGEILAIRQTIFLDAQGKPILETVDLEEGGQVIDDNGAWLVDVPMNLDYLITNEFGEQVISDDPKKGIPTKGKYRFKVKWNQSPSLSESVKRGYFLVPNVKEHGWTNSGSNPNSIKKHKSYAFSLDWDDYVDFQSAIDCTDTFYLMQYNKVYTVSQLVDQFRKGYLNSQFIGIKNILDESCESENNKFPTNDGVFRFDLIYFLFWIMLFLFRPVFISIIPVIHILWFVLTIFGYVLVAILVPLIVLVGFICAVIIKPLLGILGGLPFGLGRRFRRLRDSINCPTLRDALEIANKILSFPDKLKNIKIPNLSYPECSFCDCGDNGSLPKEEPGALGLEPDTGADAGPEGPGPSLLTPFQISSQYIINRLNNGTLGSPNVNTTDSVYQTLFAGNGLGNEDAASFTVSTRVPGLFISTNNDEAPTAETTVDAPEFGYFTSSLSVSERLNLFNTKAKYFNESGNNPGGGVNRIKVTFQPDLNTPTPTTNFHYDNVIAIVCTPNATNLEAGAMLSFQDFAQSKDLNVINTGATLNDYGTNTITGTTINSGSTTNPGTITINYANPDGSGNMATPVTYQIVTFSGDPRYARFPMDVEYFQVITGMTYSEYSGMCNSSSISVTGDWDNNNSFNNRFLSNDMRFYRITQPQEDEYFPIPINCGKNLSWSTIDRFFSPINYYKSINKQKVIFLVRGVDPNSSRTKVQYDLSRLFGYNFNNPSTIVTGDEYKLNYPIQGTLNCENHISGVGVNNLNVNYYYDSFRFEPSLTAPAPPPPPGFNPTVTFGFSSFTSNLQSYYSNLDTTNGSFTPGQSAPVLSSVTLPSSVSQVTSSYTNTNLPPSPISDIYFYQGPSASQSVPISPLITDNLISNQDTGTQTVITTSNFSVGDGSTTIVQFITPATPFADLTISSGNWVNYLYAQEIAGLGILKYWIDIDEMQSDGTTVIANIATGNSYYFNESQNSDISGYKVLSQTPTSVSTQTVTTNLTSNQQNVLVSDYITPQLGFSVIPSGVQTFKLHYLKQASSDDIKAYVEIQLADSTGTPIGSTITSNVASIGWVSAAVPVVVNLNITLPTTTINPTNRMIVRLYLNNDESFPKSIVYYTEGNSYYSLVVTSLGTTITSTLTDYMYSISLPTYVLSSVNSRIRISVRALTTGTNTSFSIRMGGSTPSRIEIPLPPNQIGTQGWNGFIVEWDVPYLYRINCSLGFPKFYSRYAGSYNLTPNDNRGYYPGEIVEGGSMMYQRLDINQTTGAGDTSILLESVYYAPRYSSGLTLNYQLTTSDPKKIVMRSDRLPTSTFVQNNLGNSFPLHTNNNFSIFLVTDEGATVNQSVAGTGSSDLFSGETGAFVPEPLVEPAVINQILESFNCGSMAPLGCYYSEEPSPGKYNLKIQPKSDNCWSFGAGKVKFDGGCYILITQPVFSLLDGSDFRIVFEWTNRIQVMFGACRNVFSHLFTNNWINGVLYPFSFSNDVIFNSLNQPVSRLCNDNIYFDQVTNNFYYRSSPWNDSTSEFVGMDRPSPGVTIEGIFGGYGGNFKNLKYPTTIMDLGPRNLYIQELVMSDDFDGYVANRLNTTTYGDVSELLNLLIITRLASPTFLSQIAGVGILTFFTRTKLMVDGDYAQMISINSELSVAPFQSINYPDRPPGQQNPIYYNPSGNINDIVFGVFFSSDTQTRDFISPKRTIIDPDGLVDQPCTFSYFSVFTQEVPFYQWNIKGQDTNSIFGSQENEWYSNPINGSAFFSYPYQLLDRTNSSSRYMRTSQRPENKYFKGYIYSVYPDGTLNPEFNSIFPNSDNDRLFNTGAPFYFYFGLKKGKSAFDRFTIKWLDTTTTL